jgi:hypothetical protein
MNDRSGPKLTISEIQPTASEWSCLSIIAGSGLELLDLAHYSHAFGQLPSTIPARLRKDWTSLAQEALLGLKTGANPNAAKEIKMKRLKTKHAARLLQLIAADIRAATGLAHAAAKAAGINARAGRVEDAIQSILEAEPKLYDAQRLMSLATNVKQIGRYREETE